MKSYLYIILFFCSTLFSSVIDDKKLVYGFYLDSLPLSNEKEAKLAKRLWIDAFTKVSNKEVDIKLYDNVDDMVYDFINTKSLDIIGFEPITFFQNKNILKGYYKKQLWTLKSYKHKYMQYYLIHNEHNSSFDLKNKTIAIKRNDISAMVWLDYLTIKNKKQSYKDIIGNQLIVNQQSSTILKVYFAEADFAVVSKTTWDITTELNPSIKNKIKIIKKSPSLFISYIGIFSKRVTDKEVDDLIKSTEILSKNPKGKQIFRLLKSREISLIDKLYINPLETFYNYYLDMKED